MWLNEKVCHPAPGQEDVYIRFGIGQNPKKSYELDIVLPKKFKEALRNRRVIGDNATYKLLLQQL